MWRNILMPIRKPWADMILSGEKPFEFRNRLGRFWGVGSKIYIYESKAQGGAGMVVGEAVIDGIVPVPANSVGPPRPLLRAWAEKFRPVLIPLLDELGDYDLPGFKKGTILRYLGQPDQLRRAMQSGQWVMMEHDFKNPVLDCEEWLSYIGLINTSGAYSYRYALRLKDIKKYASPLPLAEFGLDRAPQSWAYTKK